MDDELTQARSRAEKIARDCTKVIAIFGDSATIALVIKGKWGKRESAALYGRRGGPKGRIIADIAPGHILVTFNAQEILAAATSALVEGEG